MGFASNQRHVSVDVDMRQIEQIVGGNHRYDDKEVGAFFFPISCFV
jgi:hypothetical protein